MDWFAGQQLQWPQQHDASLHAAGGRHSMKSMQSVKNGSTHGLHDNHAATLQQQLHQLAGA
jgi:hypothetical protein